MKAAATAQNPEVCETRMRPPGASRAGEGAGRGTRAVVLICRLSELNPVIARPGQSGGRIGTTSSARELLPALLYLVEMSSISC
ncbi:hypothetical protein GCM10009658_39910 [Planotetraspora silvatica]